MLYILAKLAVYSVAFYLPLMILNMLYKANKTLPHIKIGILSPRPNNTEATNTSILNLPAHPYYRASVVERSCWYL